MPILEILQGSRAAFECRIEGWLQSPKEKREWQHMVTHVVEYAFAARSATLITVSPMEWSIGHSLPEPRRCRTARNDYLLNDIEHCTGELLATIAESEDFQRGLLWLTAQGVGRDDGLIALADRFDPSSVGPPAAQFELLLLLDDARQLHWCHPGRDSNILTNELLDIAGEYLWQPLVQI